MSTPGVEQPFPAPIPPRPPEKGGVKPPVAVPQRDAEIEQKAIEALKPPTDVGERSAPHRMQQHHATASGLTGGQLPSAEDIRHEFEGYAKISFLRNGVKNLKSDIAALKEMSKSQVVRNSAREYLQLERNRASVASEISAHKKIVKARKQAHALLTEEYRQDDVKLLTNDLHAWEDRLAEHPFGQFKQLRARIIQKFLEIGSLINKLRNPPKGAELDDLEKSYVNEYVTAAVQSLKDFNQWATQANYDMEFVALKNEVSSMDKILDQLEPAQIQTAWSNYLAVVDRFVRLPLPTTITDETLQEFNDLSSQIEELGVRISPHADRFMLEVTNLVDSINARSNKVMNQQISGWISAAATCLSGMEREKRDYIQPKPDNSYSEAIASTYNEAIASAEEFVTSINPKTPSEMADKIQWREQVDALKNHHAALTAPAPSPEVQPIEPSRESVSAIRLRAGVVDWQGPEGWEKAWIVAKPRLFVVGTIFLGIGVVVLASLTGTHTISTAALGFKLGVAGTCIAGLGPLAILGSRKIYELLRTDPLDEVLEEPAYLYNFYGEQPTEKAKESRERYWPLQHAKNALQAVFTARIAFHDLKDVQANIDNVQDAIDKLQAVEKVIATVAPGYVKAHVAVLREWKRKLEDRAKFLQELAKQDVVPSNVQTPEQFAERIGRLRSDFAIFQSKEGKAGLRARAEELREELFLPYYTGYLRRDADQYKAQQRAFTELMDQYFPAKGTIAEKEPAPPAASMMQAERDAKRDAEFDEWVGGIDENLEPPSEQ